jgi:glycerophosphoryl diester phosphodiesterase
MKKELALVKVTVAILFGSFCAVSAANTADKHTQFLIQQLEDSKSSPVLVVAHRACWRNASENTLQAIEHCIKAGMDMVEIDVRKTKDGELVVIHDETLDRTNNGAGLVSSHTLEEIQTLKTRFGIVGANAARKSAKPRRIIEFYRWKNTRQH